jgi:3-deoxy-D-manno-octulosonic acid kinase
VGTSTVIARQGQEKFVEDALRRYGTLYSFARQHAQATLPGRTGAIVIDAPGGPWVVRHYARGGAVAAVLGDRYLRFGRRRPWRELWASAWARARGIETPAVAAAVVYPGGPFYRADLATAHVPAAADLADTSIGPQRRNEEERRLAWHAAGRMVRDAAAAGLVHADLNLRNILIAWPLGLPRPYLLDLDRCRIVQRTAPHELAAMIRRLERSARKFERQSGASLAAELSAFRDGCRA